METSAHDIAMHSRSRITELRASSLDEKDMATLRASGDDVVTAFLDNDGQLFDTKLGLVDHRVRKVVSEATITGLLKEKMLADFGSNVMVRASVYLFSYP